MATQQAVVMGDIVRVSIKGENRHLYTDLLREGFEGRTGAVVGFGDDFGKPVVRVQFDPPVASWHAGTPSSVWSVCVQDVETEGQYYGDT